ncbi:hypothetical protein LABOLPEG_00033 [Pseudomonas phage phi 21A]|nr:hypothetical protein LABOLPEG_00033 [Pseudomonas phage phi 21A]
MSAMITYAAVSGAVLASSMSQSGGSGMPISNVAMVLIVISLCLAVVGLLGLLISCARGMPCDHFDEFCVGGIMGGGFILAAIVFIAAFIHDLILYA